MTDEQQAAQDRPPGVPRWVTIAGIIVGILILVLVITMLAGGNHGPGRHKLSASARPDQSFAFTSPLAPARW